ncbi:holo-ACP synthase [Acetohalobium arabaticum]|uniref:Holo-[acyl-carrier-protein] synthase n=1 Tax=Acetohalobium arabaticum (strain ATCC 49924 / DSM 5501 / Z-7288) TaxID=574087 RepID=D9QT92_ACEAZ|nr:holo-ACP synthase [Acetohalobium arabaticum]ADL13592.1 holo-acyl-carrier-protein synthase [Acetohalobium arabaticum DSM 5501]
MVTGIGVDIIEVARIKDGWEKYQDRFLDRLFTSEEVDYCLQRSSPEVHLAARFAAKEAVVKAFGTGLRGMKWTEIEVVNDQSGRPEIKLHNQAELLAKELEIREVLISLSHTKQQAIAYATALA